MSVKKEGGVVDSATPTKAPRKKATPKKAGKPAAKVEFSDEEDMEALETEDRAHSGVVTKPFVSKFAKASVEDADEEM